VGSFGVPVSAAPPVEFFSILNSLSGDGHLLADNAEGGDDILHGGSNISILGITSGASIINILTGDAGQFNIAQTQGTMTGSARGGNDELHGGDLASNTLIGDARAMFDNSVAGNDVLFGGSSFSNLLFGDAREMSGNSVAGDDVLFGGDLPVAVSHFAIFHQLYGDAETSTSSAVTGGDDRLVSGINITDKMWGDFGSGPGVGGADTFVFAGSFGNDFVYDFTQSENDMIEFQIAGVSSFTNLNINQVGLDTVIEPVGTEFDSVTLVNYNNTTNPLSDADFLFT
jgi:hypothetical protein